MLKSLRFIAVVLFLPMLTLAILAMDAQAAESRYSYRIPLAAQTGGPVRGTAPTRLPEVLQVRSTPELSVEQQARLAWHYRNAALQAEQFAATSSLPLARQGLPSRVEIFDSPKGVAEATFLPQHEYGWDVVARINLRAGVVFLGRKTPTDLYVELGKWFLYPADYCWGQDQEKDLAMLRRAEAFASFCIEKKNWVEAGGDTKSLW